MTVSPSHSLNLNGITKLTKELPAMAKKRICIVFVVPDHETTHKPYKRQNIVIPRGVPKHVSDPVEAYNQYFTLPHMFRADPRGICGLHTDCVRNPYGTYGVRTDCVRSPHILLKCMWSPHGWCWSARI